MTNSIELSNANTQTTFPSGAGGFKTALQQPKPNAETQNILELNLTAPKQEKNTENTLPSPPASMLPDKGMMDELTSSITDGLGEDFEPSKTSPLDYVTGSFMKGIEASPVPDAFVGGFKANNFLGMDILVAALPANIAKEGVTADKSTLFAGINKVGEPYNQTVYTANAAGELEIGKNLYAAGPITKAGPLAPVLSKVPGKAGKVLDKVFSFANVRTGVDLNGADTPGLNLMSVNGGLFMVKPLKSTAKGSPTGDFVRQSMTETVLKAKMEPIEAAANVADAITTAAAVLGTVASAGSGTAVTAAVKAAQKAGTKAGLKALKNIIKKEVKQQVDDYVDANAQSIIGLAGVGYRQNIKIDPNIAGTEKFVMKSQGMNELEIAKQKSDAEMANMPQSAKDYLLQKGIRVD